MFKLLYSCVNTVLQDSMFDNTGEKITSSVTHRHSRNSKKKTSLGNLHQSSRKEIELDSMLSDPSIRDSLRSDGYYKRHKQKANRKEKSRTKSRMGFKNVPLSFMKSLNTPAHSLLRGASPNSIKDSASMRLKTHIKRRTKQKKNTINSIYS